jgi:hypothetical protein
MNNPEWTGLTWDELDRLADYTAGALTGAEADEIARLIRTDDRWATAHAELLAAQPAVSAALRSAAEAPVPLPPEIAARLDAALADARSDRRAADHGTTARPATDRRGRRHRARPGRPARWSPALLRIAAGVVVFAAAGGGIATWAARGDLTGSMPALDAGEALAEDAESGAPPSTEVTVATDVGTQIIASGTDYTTASLPDLVRILPPATPDSFGKLDADLSELRVDDSLAGVATSDGLNRCLDAVQRAYPGVVSIVDFAHFEGEPAVVIGVQHGGTWTVIAVGEGCGAGGLDELAAVPVG